ncbi:MAG: lysyl oxidase family protein [Polyangiaceae bacterium]
MWNHDSPSLVRATLADRWRRRLGALGVSALSIGALVAASCSDDSETNTPPKCGDDLFCNGVERLIDNTCVKLAEDPCDDGVECTTDSCDEATKTCAHELTAGCAACQGEACEPDCTGKECGDDGCGSVCGTCGAGDGCASTLGVCAPADQLGTCVQPRPLTVTAGTTTEILGDTTSAVHTLVPTCNSTSTAVEDVYEFTVTERVGVDARSSGYDTVLSIRKTCADDSAANTIACTDDSAPPGDFGSRVEAMLDPGTYYLVVDGFDSTQAGPYTLSVTAVADCIPQCDGKFCGGDNLCGGDCGACDDGFACGPDLRCRPDPCEPVCSNTDGSPRECGDDGCLGTCGDCQSGELCVLATGTCTTFPECDHDAPTCSPACAEGSFCGSDCTCHGVGDPLPDLVINAERLADEVLFDEINVDASSCSYVESCVGGLGARKIMRFSVEAINQGQVTLNIPQPNTRPDLFEYSSCHGHFHYSGFAAYELLDQEGNVVVTGRKQAFCMEDTAQYHLGPNIGCNKLYTCEEQGIQAGWSDLYGNGLDCQWLDITDVPAGDYQLRVTLNPGHQFEELTLDNNAATVPVTIE